jgi:hypothetical protein
VAEFCEHDDEPPGSMTAAKYTKRCLTINWSRILCSLEGMCVSVSQSVELTDTQIRIYNIEFSKNTFQKKEVDKCLQMGHNTRKLLEETAKGRKVSGRIQIMWRGSKWNLQNTSQERYQGDKHHWVRHDINNHS